MNAPPHALRLLAGMLVLGTVGLIGYKVGFQGYDLSAIVPDTGYDVTVEMTFQGSGQPVRVETYLPVTDDRQQILRERNASGRLAFVPAVDRTGARGVWQTDEAQGPHTIQYVFHAQIDELRFDLSDSLRIPTSYPPPLAPYLQATPEIQVDDPVIAALHREVVPATDRLVPVVRSIFDHAMGLEPMPFRGRTDALTAARLGEASCNGKSRLFLALARRAGLPGRLVGGLILTEGAKRVSHQWAELYINGYWVPFDALNGHFGSLPSDYLALYYGDEFLFRHTSHIDFDWRFRVDKRQASQELLASALQATGPSLNPYRFWNELHELGLSFELLRLLLLIPLGATLVVVFRNVIGLETYGVFLPALVATACLQSGLAVTLAGFLVVTAVVAALYVPLSRWGLLYTPKMALMLLAVVGTLLGLCYLGLRSGWFDFTYLAFLPLVIVAVTAERFAQHLDEEGVLKAGRVMGMTMFVVVACYAVMQLPVVQLLFLAFPELLLGLAAVNLGLGRWIGMRMTEYRRFRWLLDRAQGAKALVPFHEQVVGINRRNARVIYPSNPRRYFPLADDKVLTKEVLEQHGVPVPPTHAVFSEIGQIRAEWPLLDGLSEFVVKPARGKAGNNILVLAREGAYWETPGGRRFDAARLQKAIADIIFGMQSNGAWDRALVEHRVHAHPFFTRLYAHGLPDIRILTQEGRLVQAMMRLPTDASDGKANLHQGALGVGIDLATGRMGPGYDYHHYLDRHPDTGVVFEGAELPCWGEMVAISEQVAALIPLGYLGIDLVVDRDRGPLVMEVNARPGIEIQNVNRQGLRPLLEVPHAA